MCKIHKEIIVKELSIEFLKDWFNKNPQYKNDVNKAHYAYFINWPEKHAHRYNGTVGYEDRYNERCYICGRSRFDVRWDDRPGECEFYSYKNPEEVANILYDEEIKFAHKIKSLENIVPSVIEKKGLSGSTLAFLHHTYGGDIDIVQGIIGEIPLSVIKEYNIEIEKHNETGKQGFFKAR